MSAGAKISLDFDTLVQHAARVEQISADIGEASQAISSINLTGGAFGVLCNFLIAPAQIVTTVAGSLVRDCEHLMQRTGTQLRKTATEAGEREQELVSQLRAIQRGIG